MLNGTVDVQRALGRLHRTRGLGPSAPTRVHHRSLRVARSLQAGVTSLTRPTTSRTGAGGQTAALHLPRRLSIKAGSEAILPVAVVLIVVFASLLSWLPGRATPSGPVGGPAGDGPGPRVALGGLAGGGGTDGAGPTEANPAETTTNSSTPSSQRVGTTARDPEAATLAGRGGAPVTPGARPYSLDGTIMKPVAVDTSVADGRALLKHYKVSKGDTLTGIANRFGVSMMTVWWANNLKSRTDFRVGDTLTIPPVDGIVFTAREGDTLAAVGQTYDVDPETIYKMNGLEDRVLLVGQTLVLPGAVGTAIATPGRKTPLTSKSTSKPKPPSSSTSAGPPIHEPTEYTGGPMLWPVLGGANFISQYFHAGHYAIDIAADYGSRAVAAASGTVIFAGWKSNGGGYQVWIAHGSGLYTTYNHMSAVTVGRGQTVARGQQVGRVGQSGNASGPHLHFEVWRGPVWNGGTRVNPLIYL